MSATSTKTSLDETKLDTRLPYRGGYPILPVLPLKRSILATYEASNLPVSEDPGYQVLQDIINKYNISFKELHITIKHFTRLDKESIITLVLSCVYEEGCQPRWIAAVKDIHAGLANVDITNRAIEIIDHRAALDPLRIGCMSSDEDQRVMQAWNKALRREIKNTIEDREWSSVSLFKQEFPSKGMRPTVVVCAKDAQDEVWWKETLPALEKVLKDRGVDVEISLCRG